MGKDVADLADAEDRAPRRGQPVEQRRFVRRHGIVAPVRRSPEVGAALTDERPRDHPSDVQRIDQLADRFAKVIEPLQSEMGLVRGDLEHRVRGGVADRLSRPDVLFAEFGDDLGARSMLVAQYARNAALLDDGRGEVRGKGRDRLRKISPVEGDRQAGDLPVPRRRILAARHLVGRAEEAGDIADIALFAGCQFGCREQSERAHHGQLQRTASQAVAIAVAARAGFQYMAERVRTGVAETLRIGSATDTEGIKDKEESARHRGCSGQIVVARDIGPR